MGSPHARTRTHLPETVELKRSRSFPSKRDLCLLGSRTSATLSPLARSQTVAEDTPRLHPPAGRKTIPSARPRRRPLERLPRLPPRSAPSVRGLHPGPALPHLSVVFLFPT